MHIGDQPEWTDLEKPVRFRSAFLYSLQFGWSSWAVSCYSIRNKQARIVSFCCMAHKYTHTHTTQITLITRRFVDDDDNDDDDDKVILSFVCLDVINVIREPMQVNVHMI